MEGEGGGEEGVDCVGIEVGGLFSLHVGVGAGKQYDITIHHYLIIGKYIHVHFPASGVNGAVSSMDVAMSDEFG